MEQLIIGGVITIFASSGFWTFITYKATAKDKSKSEKEEKLNVIESAILAVLHDRLFQSCSYYLTKGEISIQDLDNVKHLFTAYKSLGGNGTGEEIYKRILKLPLNMEEGERNE